MLDRVSVPGMVGYEVDSSGRVFSMIGPSRRSTELTPQLTKAGRLQVAFVVNRKGVRSRPKAFIDEVVLYSFTGRWPWLGRPVAIDGNIRNCSLGNLVWNHGDRADWGNIAPVVGYHRLHISDHGEVFRKRNPCFVGHDVFQWIRPFVSEDGYEFIRVGDTVRGVHQLVAEAFCGPRLPEHVCVRHLDGNKTNNWSGNLAWGTIRENNEDTAAMMPDSFWPRGEKNPSSKLTEAKVAQIFDMARSGMTNPRIARTFGVTPAAVRNVLIGKTWRHLNLSEGR